MKKIVFAALALLSLAACNPQPEYATRAEKIMAEIKNPSSDYVLVAVHRGDWRNYPENSIPAMESIIRMGADIMELDVKMTRDSQLIVSHDWSLRRMTNVHPNRDPSYPSDNIRDLTLAQIKALKLKRAHGVTTDSLRVPTLEEALICCKDRIIVNLDGGTPYFDEIMALGEKLGMVEQLLFKGGRCEYVMEHLKKYDVKPMYMPIVSPLANDDIDKFIQAGIDDPSCKPVSYELCWNRQACPEDYKEAVAKVKAAGSRAWTNTIWSSLCGVGWDDDAAFDAEDPGEVYGPILEAGVSMFQTDRPELILDYLRKIGRHD